MTTSSESNNSFTQTEIDWAAANETSQTLWTRSALKLGSIVTGVALALSPDLAHSVREAVENTITTPVDPFITDSGSWLRIDGGVMRLPQPHLELVNPHLTD
jgi:hypothetical protein